MKYTVEELYDKLKSFKLSDKGVEQALEAIELSPTRSPRASSIGKNRAIRMPSLKMGFVMPTESHRLEFFGSLIKEFDDSVFGYWPQPPAINLKYLSGKRNVVVNRTFDFFVIENDFVGYEEWKPYKELFKLAKRNAQHISFNEKTEEFHSPAVEASLAGTGLSYRYRYEKHAPSILVKNLEFLFGFLRNKNKKSIIPKTEKVQNLIELKGPMVIKEIATILGESDGIYYALVSKLVFADIENYDFMDINNCMIYSNNHEIDFSKKVKVIEKSSLCQRQEFILGNYDEFLISKAAQMLNLIEENNKGRLDASEAAKIHGVSIRTFYRAKEKVVSVSGRSNKIQELLQKDQKKGNRGTKISKDVDKIIKFMIEKHYLSKSAPNKRTVVTKVFASCEKNELSKPSETTIYERINRLDRINATLVREGRRAAYQQTAYEMLDVGEDWIFSASRYLQCCHIDHTQIDVEVVVDIAGNTGRPFLTVIIDEFTGKILSFFLSFDNPSYISVMVAIRFMVLEHEALPECFVVDGGKEFKSKDFELLAATYNIAIKSREGQPRGGIAVERIFGTLNEKFFHSLEGNTKPTKEVRSISKSHYPKYNARWTLSEISILLGIFINRWSSRSIKSFGVSPDDLVCISNKYFGEREFLEQRYDEFFEIVCMPYVKNKSATLRRGNPVTHLYNRYWHQDFRFLKKEKIKVLVKWDPADVDRVFVFLEKRWVVCKRVNIGGAVINESRSVKSQSVRESMRINEKSRRNSVQEIINIDEILSERGPIECESNIEHENDSSNLKISFSLPKSVSGE